jgi:hypothetical protein
MRETRRNPNHHIWCNNGTYFVNVTVRLRGRGTLRLRKSLRTKDLAEARRRRDRLFESIRAEPGMELVQRRLRAS